MAKIIFLIGMPAAGKSFWASKIAAAYSLQFVDLDQSVAQQEQASIPALFASYGENGFREREQKHLLRIINKTTADTIIASGGGTPCFADNMELMKRSGTVIYLDADLPYLLANIQHSQEVRPLLQGRENLAAYLAALLQKRKKIYEQAHHILSAQNISLTTFDEIITACISRH